MMEKNKRDIGKEGEDIAVKFLQQNGFEIIERNYHYSTSGEIDIVAKDKEQLVFVEVKSRLNLEFGEPEYGVTPQKIKQIKRMAELYLYEKEIEEVNCRFDVAAVILNDGSEPIITYYKNAFM